MLDALKSLERSDLAGMLCEPEETWSTLDIIYHPPHVERVWRTHGELRIYLHRIWPCDDGEALLHPHDWPGAVKLLSGAYEHGIASVVDGAPQKLVTLELAAGSYYEMSEARAWHYVRPLRGPALSLMITGRPYTKGSRELFDKPPRPQTTLDPAIRREILDGFRQHYPRP